MGVPVLAVVLAEALQATGVVCRYLRSTSSGCSLGIKGFHPSDSDQRTLCAALWLRTPAGPAIGDQVRPSCQASLPSRESEIVEVEAGGDHAANQNLVGASRSGRPPEPSRDLHLRTLSCLNI
jgi:hypothetical protein